MICLLKCLDVDECLNNPCGNHATCRNVNIGFSCSCNYGYKKNDDGMCEGKLCNLNDSILFMSFN